MNLKKLCPPNMLNMYNNSSTDSIYSMCTFKPVAALSISPIKMGLTIQIGYVNFFAAWTSDRVIDPTHSSFQETSSPRLGSQRLLWPCNTRISSRSLASFLKSVRVTTEPLLSDWCINYSSCNTSTPLDNNSDWTASRVLLNKSFARWKRYCLGFVDDSTDLVTSWTFDIQPRPSHRFCLQISEVNIIICTWT